MSAKKRLGEGERTGYGELPLSSAPTGTKRLDNDGLIMSLASMAAAEHEARTGHEYDIATMVTGPVDIHLCVTCSHLRSVWKEMAERQADALRAALPEEEKP